MGKETVKFKFDTRHPASYILSITLLLALKKNVSKKTPIHILGLGSPILILLAGYMFKDFKSITVDATSSYDDDLRADKIFGISKMDLFKFISYQIVDKKPYYGISPYFKVFEEKYNSDWPKLFSHFKEDLANKNLSTDEMKRGIVLDKLKINSRILETCVPFFVPLVRGKRLKALGKVFKRELIVARAFENYWAIKSLCNDLSSFNSKKELDKYIDSKIKEYSRSADGNYLNAVYECKYIIDTFK